MEYSYTKKTNQHFHSTDHNIYQCPTILTYKIITFFYNVLFPLKVSFQVYCCSKRTFIFIGCRLYKPRAYLIICE